MTGRCHRTGIRVLMVAAFCFFNILNVLAGDPDYPEIFGDNWLKAGKFINDNRNWMTEQLKDSRTDFQFTMAVVFPELVRYSAIRDRMEITLLKALYVQYGTEYADFSVGVFQMKPSCAEGILKEIQLLKDRKLEKKFKPLSKVLNDHDRRAMIIRDMENPQMQLTYITVLLKLLDERYRNRKWKNTESKLAFYATAYNCGFNQPEDYILKRMEKNSFHTGLISSDRKYSYSGIACYYYREFIHRSE